jgi:hypothetical protein
MLELLQTVGDQWLNPLLGDEYKLQVHVNHERYLVLAIIFAFKL